MYLRLQGGREDSTTPEGFEESPSGLRTETDRVVLDYRSRSNGDEWQDMHYPVYLAWSGCNYGGQCAWWLCPAAGCRRRVAVLYGGKVYGSRADTIRKRLGWDAGILNLPGGKPKGMHWQTFERLQAAHDAHVNQALAGMTAKLGLAMERLEGIRRKV